MQQPKDLGPTVDGWYVRTLDKWNWLAFHMVARIACRLPKLPRFDVSRPRLSTDARCMRLEDFRRRIDGLPLRE